MTSKKPVAVFAFTHPWMQKMVNRVAPPEFEVLFLDIKNEEEAHKVLPRADFLIGFALPGKYVPLLQNCKLVQAQGVGYDSIDTNALNKAGIPLAITPEGTITGVAEHIILFILALYKQLVQVHESLREGKYDGMGWRANSHFFCGKTLGIVGIRRVGQRVSQLVRGFEVNLIYYDVLRLPETLEQEICATYTPFEELLSQSDIISVNTPLTAETKGLFGSGEYARMKSGALFINTSRGETYDMDALCESLISGHLGGAGLDVFNPEPPPPDHPILRLPNVICTPHMATGTIEAHLIKAREHFDNFFRVLQGEEPHNLIVPATQD